MFFSGKYVLKILICLYLIINHKTISKLFYVVWFSQKIINISWWRWRQKGNSDGGSGGKGSSGACGGGGGGGGSNDVGRIKEWRG